MLERELSGKPVRGKHSRVVNVPTAVGVYLIALTGLCIIADGCSAVLPEKLRLPYRRTFASVNVCTCV